MDLIELFNSRKIDYSKFNLFTKNVYLSESYDLTVIIPVRGRVHFQDSVLLHFHKAAAKAGKRVAVTFVEYSKVPEFDKRDDCSYIHIPCEETDEFNKCLCMNIGFLYGPKSSYYLFHDSDLICGENFFVSIFADLYPAMQCFKEKRVIYASEYLTEKIIKREEPVGILDENHPNVQVGDKGAPGGSILLSTDFFEFVGGYDPEYFSGYSVEDQFFYDKVSLLCRIKSLERENLIHLNHGTDHAVTKDSDFEIYHTWRDLSEDNKINLIRLKRNYLRQFLR
jgi:hypothetical protein